MPGRPISIMEKIRNKITFIVQYLRRFAYEHRVRLLQCIPAAVIFLLATYRMSETGMPILFNDEIGYWSNSAFFLGTDWKSVTGRIGYYSYGYSLLLIPLRLLATQFAWRWDALYHAGIVLNACFLVASYGLALKLSERYLPKMGCFVRTAACFTLFTYSSYIVYAHITWTECTLVFFFWVFLYVMMRVVDRPGIGNHIAFALVSFYIYTVHQRALGIIAASVLVVLYMRLLGRNRLKDTAAFLGSMYLYSLIHTMVKTNLQNVNYLGAEPVGMGTVLGYALTKRAGVVLAAGAVLLLFLWLLEKRKYKAVLLLAASGILLGTAYLRINGDILSKIFDSAGTNRLSTNDFSGQLGVVRNLFTRNGLIRLGISITGKWFYMASVTGLVVCWGIYGLFENAFILLRGHVRRILPKNRAAAADDGGADVLKDRIWFLGLLLAWFSTFMISAIYKEGFYKNDDLVNGRYTEFVLGFVLLFGFYRLINDKKWVRTAAVCMILYLLAGKLCQYAWDELQRKEFELAHCVMFGRVVWNYEVPYGKVERLWDYVLPMTVSFMILLKPARDRFPKAAAARTALALMIPVLAWSYLGKTIVDAYVVVRNEKQEEPFTQFSEWMRIIGDGEPVYCICDSGNDRNPGLLQYMMQEEPMTVVPPGALTFEEDAFYVMKDYLWTPENPAWEECEIMQQRRGYVVVIRNDGKLAERWGYFH